jgi:hypothetical protein
MLNQGIGANTVFLSNPDHICGHRSHPCSRRAVSPSFLWLLAAGYPPHPCLVTLPVVQLQHLSCFFKTSKGERLLERKASNLCKAVMGILPPNHTPMVEASHRFHQYSQGCGAVTPGCEDHEVRVKGLYMEISRHTNQHGSF